MADDREAEYAEIKVELADLGERIAAVHHALDEIERNIRTSKSY